MIGAIIGDLAGSVYEFAQFKKCTSVKVNNIIEDDSFISDDTILTIAILDAILSNCSYETKLKEYGIKYYNQTPKNIPYFETMFSPSFVKWAKGDFQGSSCGNGAMMRISPVGYMFDNEEDVINNAYQATIPSHNTDEAIQSAKIVALIILYSRQGYSKEQIINKLNLKIQKPTINEFNYTCSSTIDLCLYSLFNSNSFEESIKTAISFGGDTDTNACIVGGMAEAMFGVDDKLINKALSKLPKNFATIINKAYSQMQNKSANVTHK